MNILLDTTSDSQREIKLLPMYKSLNNKGYGLVQLLQIRLRPFSFYKALTNKATMFGQNGQIPHFLEIFSKKTLFRK